MTATIVAGCASHRTAAAEAPFAGFGETRLALGDRCLRVLVAATQDQRVQGLRDVRSLCAVRRDDLRLRARHRRSLHDGEHTPPLDITFFAADGKPVDRTRMTPCPTGTDATCPIYESAHRYRYALERVAGAAGGGALASCAA